MLNLEKSTISNFGKVIFVPSNHTIPSLPDMKLLIFKKENTYQAICIDLELDAIGSSLEDSWNNLKQTLMCYISDMLDTHNGNLKDAVKYILDVVYSKGEIKTLLFNKYLEAKHLYILDNIARKNKAKSRSEIFIKILHRIFIQRGYIKYDLTRTPAFA